MICPHCSLENPQLSLTCHRCGQVLSLDPALPIESSWNLPSTSNTSPLALAALAAGLVGIFPLAAVLAIVLGHTALISIRRSDGELRGRDVARLALICAYSGLILFSALILATSWHSKAPLRALLVGEASAAKPPTAVFPGLGAAESRAAQALSYIHTAQVAFRMKHPRGSYTCQLNELEPFGISPREIASASNAGYVVSLQQCRTDENGRVAGYEVLAISRIGVQGRNICADESGILRTPTETSGLTDCTRTGTRLH